MQITRIQFGEIEQAIMAVISLKLKTYLQYCILVLAFNAFEQTQAHPMPNSMVVLTIHDKYISGQIQLPLGELQSAFGMNVNDYSEKLIERLGDSLKIYLKKHIQSTTFDKKPWDLSLGKIYLTETKNKITGDYKELIVAFSMKPPPFYDLRNFYFNYDVIIHQVITHKILISIKQDWQQGILHEDDASQEVGIIDLDIPSGKILPFQVSLDTGSNWKGFKNMVSLGITHIKEGTDHVLFIITLLFPALLLVENNRWSRHKGLRLSALNLLKIISAFTLGHSLTLLLGSIKIVQFSSNSIEILIGFTILISAIHSFRPIYPSREVLIASAFGLIHGLAFSQTLTNLELSNKQLILSVLGFNIGIEIMQLLIILVIIPSLFILSRTKFYTFFRILAAMLSMIAALAWILERIGMKKNTITVFIEAQSIQLPWLATGFFILSLLIFFMDKKLNRN